MEKNIKQFTGFSGSLIYLMEDNQRKFIRKINNIERNYNKLVQLNDLNYNVPKIYQKNNNSLDIEYIHGVDMYTFLKLYDSNLLLEFLINLINRFKEKEEIKDYTEVYKKKLDEIEDYHSLPFTKNELLNKLPLKLPQSICHGDLTLDNLIFSKNNFYMIDCSTGNFNSWVFDLAKLRQDLKCKWYLRNKPDKSLYNCLDLIDSTLARLYPVAFNDNLLILMLLRVYIYTKKDSSERQFILENIKNLWK
jgi:thiamine kinase-like enzyme